MLVTAFVSIALVLKPAFAAPADRFYANAEFQRQAPAAFVLQPETLPAPKALAREANAERGRFLSLLKTRPDVLDRVNRYPSLSEPQRESLLREVFDLEVRSLGILAPTLIIENDRIPGSAFFDFDLSRPGPGTVILNPRELAKEKNPYAGLLLLIHETRHSAQLQRARQGRDDLARAYGAAFEAQKKLKGFSFCDFMTLMNEYEAFQYANEVFGHLTGFRLDAPDMGSFASQYDGRGLLKIDLLRIAMTEGPSKMLTRFNELERDQARQLGLP